jgi:hypothetical protein
MPADSPAYKRRNENAANAGFYFAGALPVHREDVIWRRSTTRAVAQKHTVEPLVAGEAKNPPYRPATEKRW